MEEMKSSNTTKSGIGRRRGAKKKKSLQTSLIVSLVSFCITFFVIIGVYLHSMPRSSKIRSTSQLIDAPLELAGGTAQLLKRRRDKHTNNELSEQTKKALLDEKLSPILKSSVHLFDLDLSNLRPHPTHGYIGAKAKFCKLNWDLHKYNPPVYPMFRFLVSESGCNDADNVLSVDMGKLISKVKEYDESIASAKNNGHNHIDTIENYVHVMPPTGFVFHESRVGSTLVANSLAAMDPEANRVFSESNPINMALQVCERGGEDCDMEMAAQVFRDVVYLMGRTDSVAEKHLFFKVSSAGTKRMKVMREAFPETPWIFVYRNPVQTMMSHLDPDKIGRVGRNKHIMAVCTKARRNPPEDLVRLVKDAGRDIDEISDIEFCAAHLNSLCESALIELRKSSTGKAVEYDDLVEKLISDVIPNHFGIEMTKEGEENIRKVSKTYSKNKGSRNSEWKEDSEKKENRASKEIVDASEFFMTKSYEELKTFTNNIN